MNILQVLSQYEVTGAETFAATLSDELIKQGHTVFIVSDTFRTPTKAEIIIHPVGKRDIIQRYTNIQFLKKLIKEKHIDVVHAHSRAASWICFFATRGGSVPLVSSLHYRQHLHFSSKLFSVYGEKRVAVCKSIYTHLNRDLKYPLRKLALIHNGIDLSRWEFRKRVPRFGGKKIVSFVGRLTGFKGDSLMIIIKEIFPAVYAAQNNVEFHIVGALEEGNPVRTAVEETNKKIGKTVIHIKGFSSNVEEVYRSSDVIIGSGRVAMEALACGAIVVSIGESNAVGIISEQTAQEALVTNFGDLDARRPIDVDGSVRDILRAVTDPESVSLEWGRAFIENNFEIKKVTKEMVKIFAEAVAQKNGVHEIPVLSYHTIVSQGGNERTIAVAELEQQMQTLQKNSFTAINFFEFRDIAAFRKKMPAKPVILVFEWNAESHSLVLPLLKKYGLTGLFLVQTNLIKDRKQDIVDLHTNGMEMVSYSHTGRKFNLLSAEEIHEEVRGSLNVLQSIINGEIITFAYPHGYCTEAIKKTVKDAGYQFGISLDEGRRNIWEDFLKIRRIQIFNATSKFSFWKKTSGYYYRYNDVY